MHKSLKWMLDNPIEGVLEHTFVIETPVLGQVQEAELVPNGAEIAVTDANKRQYAELYAAATMELGIKEQIAAVCEGFHELVPARLLEQLSVADLHVALSGLPTISVLEWKRHTDVLPTLAEL